MDSWRGWAPKAAGKFWSEGEQRGGKGWPFRWKGDCGLLKERGSTIPWSSGRWWGGGKEFNRNISPSSFRRTNWGFTGWVWWWRRRSDQPLIAIESNGIPGNSSASIKLNGRDPSTSSFWQERVTSWGITEKQKTNWKGYFSHEKRDGSSGIKEGLHHSDPSLSAYLLHPSWTLLPFLPFLLQLCFHIDSTFRDMERDLACFKKAHEVPSFPSWRIWSSSRNPREFLKRRMRQKKNG